MDIARESQVETEFVAEEIETVEEVDNDAIVPNQASLNVKAPDFGSPEPRVPKSIIDIEKFNKLAFRRHKEYELPKAESKKDMCKFIYSFIQK